MNEREMNDQKIRDLVHDALDNQARDSASKSPKFEVLWARAQQVLVNQNPKPLSRVWIRHAIIPVLAASAIAFYVRFQNSEKMESTDTTRSLSMSQTQLVLPTDGLLRAAQNLYVMSPMPFTKSKYNLIKPEYPTNSLKWRTQ